MATINLIIDLGSSYTTIFKSGEGIVLHEPTLCLLSGDVVDNGKIIAYGIDAKKMVGNLPEGHHLLYPIQEGAIAYRKAAMALVSYFLKKVVNRNDYFIKPKISVFVNVPCGCQQEERELIQNLFHSCGVMEVYELDAPIFAYYGSTNAMESTESQLVVDIGGGLTNIALIGANGIDVGYSFGIGGHSIDKGIVEGLESSANVKVGILTAEQIKCDIGSLYENENNYTKVFGKNFLTGNPRSATITSKYIRSMLEYYYGKIADLIINILKDFSDETLTSIFKNGIIVTGGGAKITGLEWFLKEKLECPIIIPELPDFSAIRGGAKLLSDPLKLNQLLKIM